MAFRSGRGKSRSTGRREEEREERIDISILEIPLGGEVSHTHSGMYWDIGHDDAAASSTRRRRGKRRDAYGKESEAVGSA